MAARDFLSHTFNGKGPHTRGREAGTGPLAENIILP